MLETLIQEADYALRQSPVRKREWHIQRNEDTKICATLLGPIKLIRTYYKHITNIKKTAISPIF